MPRGGALFGVLMLLPALLAGPVGASEDGHDHGGVHEFHEMMEELGENTQRIVQAINHEDWAWAAREARMIADHSRPPAEERARLKAFTADRHAKFAKYDKAVHETAAELAKVAEQGEGREVINAFARLQSSCLDCHASFRDDFREHFYHKD
jgi:cytochrome c556